MSYIICFRFRRPVTEDVKQKEKEGKQEYQFQKAERKQRK